MEHLNQIYVNVREKHGDVLVVVDDALTADDQHREKMSVNNALRRRTEKIIIKAEIQIEITEKRLLKKVLHTQDASHLKKVKVL